MIGELVKQDITDRQEKILYSIIDSYLDTAEPVGSRTLNKRYDLGVSPATIRNEMSDLEDLSLIMKAHSSSGRIPTDSAYRRYVDDLMNKINAKLDATENQSLSAINYNQFIDADKIIVEAARILSSLTNYTCITMIKMSSDVHVEHIELLPINHNNFVVVVVYSTGDVGNHIIHCRNILQEEDVKKINFHLRSLITKREINEIKTYKNELIRKLADYPFLIDSIIKVIEEEFNSFKELDFHTQGLTNIFDYPEYSDIKQLREFIEFTENKQNIMKLFQEEDAYFYVKIGKENSIDILKDNTVIVSTYLLNQRVKGKIALIAPKRMNYPKVIEAVMTISWKINHMINNRN